MRHLVLIIIAISCFQFAPLKAQQYILLDKKFSKPVIQRDTVTDQDLNSGFFPIDKSNVDSLVIALNKLQEIIDPKKEREVINMSDYDLSHVSFAISTVKRAYGDRYDITITSFGRGFKVSMLLCSSDFSNSFNKKKLHDVADYIETNHKAWNEKFYTHP